jgi:hypothetical protein
MLSRWLETEWAVGSYHEKPNQQLSSLSIASLLKSNHLHFDSLHKVAMLLVFNTKILTYTHLVSYFTQQKLDRLVDASCGTAQVLSSIPLGGEF